MSEERTTECWHRISFLFILYLAVSSVGCSSRPDAELKLALEAMEQAKGQHAAEFAAAEWKSGEEAWEQAHALLAKESYSQARMQLLRAKSRFEKARDIAKAKRDVVLKDVQGIQKEIDRRYQALKDGVGSSGARLSAARKKSLEDAFREIDRGLEKMKAEIQQGEYNDARNSAQTTARWLYEAERVLPGSLGGKKN